MKTVENKKDVLALNEEELNQVTGGAETLRAKRETE